MILITGSLEFQTVMLTNRDLLRLKLDLMKLELRETNILTTKKERNLVQMISKIFTAKLKERRELLTTSISTPEVKLETFQITLKLEDHSVQINDQFLLE